MAVQAPAPPAKEPPKITLPSELSKPVPKLSALKGLLYARPKFGKSTFGAGIPNHVFIATERGLDDIACFKIEDPYPIKTWDELKSAVNTVVQSDRFGAMIIDTADNAYRLCVEHVCEQKKWKHPEDPGYGKGWAYVDAEFESFLRKLSYLDTSVWFISHAVQRTVETRTGDIKVWGPTLRDSPSSTSSPFKVILGWAQVILFGDFEPGGTKRVIRTRPTQNYEAGDRTKTLPETIPFTWDEFAAAFNAGAARLKSGKHSKTEGTESTEAKSEKV